MLPYTNVFPLVWPNGRGLRTGATATGRGLRQPVAGGRQDGETHVQLPNRQIRRQPGTCSEGRKGNVLFNDALNTFYLRVYGIGHMVKDTQIMREETRCRHMGYSFRLAARVLLYASSHRQDNTYHSLCYTSCGTLAGTRNSSMGPPSRIDPTTHRTMSEHSYHGATSHS